MWLHKMQPNAHHPNILVVFECLMFLVSQNRELHYLKRIFTLHKIILDWRYSILFYLEEMMLH